MPEEGKQLHIAGNEDIEQGTGATSSKTNLISDQNKEPINNTGSGHTNFLWPSSEYHKHCCIYRVPYRLRKVNPDAYTPQMLLIGPLQHSMKFQAKELSIKDMRYMDYMRMEDHKKMYLENFTTSYGNQCVHGFRKIIENYEVIIRACYAESTKSIQSQEFIEMMLLDSVFILVFFLQREIHQVTQNIGKTGDFIFDSPSNITTILEDLILLENQLPYFLLEKLFKPFLQNLNKTLRDFIFKSLDIETKIGEDVKFLHFTDLKRCVRLETLSPEEKQQKSYNHITYLHTAYELHTAGVRFRTVKEAILKNTSLEITFKSGTLTMACFTAEDSTEMKFRNIMALEQCHYPDAAFVCNYISFLDFLIDSEQDVDYLVRKGVIRNLLGREGSIAEMVNKLCLGLVDYGSQYYDIAERLNKHSHNIFYTSIATLRRVYFKDPWTGTATITAVILVVLTLISTVAAVLSTKHDLNDSSN